MKDTKSEINLITRELDFRSNKQLPNNFPNTRTIEFDVQTKIIELDKIIREAHQKQRSARRGSNIVKIKRIRKLLTPFLKSKNQKVFQRITDILDILDEIA